MEYIYVMISGEWEDSIIFLNKTEAVEASVKHPMGRVEIFEKNDDSPGYSPTYSYYKNGVVYYFNR